MRAISYAYFFSHVVSFWDTIMCFNHNPRSKIWILLEFSLTWIWLTCLLAFHMPWDRSYSNLHYPIEEIYKETFGYIEMGRIEEQENYNPLLPKLILESASLCPLEQFCVLPKLAFCQWACYREMEDWGGGGPSGGFISPVHRRAVRGCIYLVISDLY